MTSRKRQQYLTREYIFREVKGVASITMPLTGLMISVRNVVVHVQVRSITVQLGSLHCLLQSFAGLFDTIYRQKSRVSEGNRIVG